MSRQRQWALQAHTAVKHESVQKSDTRTSYATHCKKGPSLLQRAGVAQGLAFLCSRKVKTDAGRKYADDLARIYGSDDGLGLLRKAQTAAFADYLVLSRDLLAIAGWLRRFGQIEFADVEGQD